MAGTLIPWPWAAVGAFAAFFFVHRAWSGAAAAVSAARGWLLWLAASWFAAVYFQSLLHSLPGAPSAWRLRWWGSDFQVLAWMLCLLPFSLGLSLDWNERSGWPRSGSWGLWGLAFGPWIAGAYSLEQARGFAPPFFVLILCAVLFLRSAYPWKRPLRTLALFNLIALLFGSVDLPFWALAVSLLVLYSSVLCPFGRRAAVAGFVIGGAAQIVSASSPFFARVPTGWAVGLAIAVGWTLFRTRGNGPHVTPA